MSTFLFQLLQLLDVFEVGVPIEIMSSTIGLKICAITAGIKKSIIKKKKKKHAKIVLLAKRNNINRQK